MNLIWSKDYEVGDFWTRTELPILSTEPFQIVLEAVAGNGYAGDIAIDDVSFTTGCVLSNVDLVTVTTPIPTSTTANPCEAHNQFMCLENRQCIDRSKVCDFTVDCPTPGGSDEAECGTCTFDDKNGTYCGWKDFSYGTLQWNLVHGSTVDGPSGDHTTGTGFYMAVAASSFYNFASKRTPAIGPTGYECQLKFWYYMDVDDASSYAQIVVYKRDEAYNFTGFVFIDGVSEGSGSQWKQATINLGEHAERFAIGRVFVFSTCFFSLLNFLSL